MQKIKRPSWGEYFMELATVAAKRSTCLRRAVGAIAVRDKQILATGYNGSPSGIKHCDEVGCIREQLKVPSGERHELCRGIHAEQNLIIQAASNGIALKGCTIYCTHHPCIVCAKMLINIDVKRVVYGGDYPDEMAGDMLTEAGIKVEKFDNNRMV